MYLAPDFSHTAIPLNGSPRQPKARVSQPNGSETCHAAVRRDTIPAGAVPSVSLKQASLNAKATTVETRGDEHAVEPLGGRDLPSAQVPDEVVPLASEQDDDAITEDPCFDDPRKQLDDS